mgnify:CR=1 FL=1
MQKKEQHLLLIIFLKNIKIEIILSNYFFEINYLIKKKLEIFQKKY